MYVWHIHLRTTSCWSWVCMYKQEYGKLRGWIWCKGRGNIFLPYSDTQLIYLCKIIYLFFKIITRKSNRLFCISIKSQQLLFWFKNDQIWLIKCSRVAQILNRKSILSYLKIGNKETTSLCRFQDGEQFSGQKCYQGHLEIFGARWLLKIMRLFS